MNKHSVDNSKASDLLKSTNVTQWRDGQAELFYDKETLKSEIVRHFNHTLGREFCDASAHSVYQAVAMTIRDRVIDQWRQTRELHRQQDARKTCYLSMEYLMGRALSNALINLDLTDTVREALADLHMNLDDIEDLEADAGLGNGGLGRLAACFMDSCATLSLPVIGYGIRYHYGMFHQQIENGYQIEKPDNWLRQPNIWEISRSELACRVRFGGRTEQRTDDGSSPDSRDWVDTTDVLAHPYDVPIPGYMNGIVNTLRLWSAEATDEFNLDEFNAGSYTAAVATKNEAENITMVLYPNDASENGKQLRLRQQYFLVSASLQDCVRLWLSHGADFEEFADKHCFQLNDTHPTLAVPELMRILIDDHGLSWDTAWGITTRCMAYTNHTLLPEALEKWSVHLIQQLMPRIWEIIQRIDQSFEDSIRSQFGDNQGLVNELSIIERNDDPKVRMAHLAIVGSYSVNGVAQLHSDLLRSGLFRRFAEMWPDKFNNKTNGVTQRRWMAQCNPGIRVLLTETIGESWITRLDDLEKLAPYADDAVFRQRWLQMRRQNKIRLADLVRHRCGVDWSVDALFDVQVKRMHEYKRQLLNALHAVHLHQRLRAGDDADWTPRCILIAGKAAPGYEMAKAIVKMINNIARVINEDPVAAGRLSMVFLPDYNVSAMETICPAADLSEQISTAGKEASGTGNMKFMMNGSLTIGTLDGANVEILDAVGADNFYLFGMTVEEVAEMRRHYNPAAIMDRHPAVSNVIKALQAGRYNVNEPGIFDGIIGAMLSPEDPWMTVADFPSYIETQQQVARDFQDQEKWLRMSILNTAAAGRFSTDRTMREYNQDIWRLQPSYLPGLAVTDDDAGTGCTTQVG